MRLSRRLLVIHPAARSREPRKNQHQREVHGVVARGAVRHRPDGKKVIRRGKQRDRDADPVEESAERSAGGGTHKHALQAIITSSRESTTYAAWLSVSHNLHSRN